MKKALKLLLFYGTNFLLMIIATATTLTLFYPGIHSLLGIDVWKFVDMFENCGIMGSTIAYCLLIPVLILSLMICGLFYVFIWWVFRTTVFSHRIIALILWCLGLVGITWLTYINLVSI